MINIQPLLFYQHIFHFCLPFNQKVKFIKWPTSVACSVFPVSQSQIQVPSCFIYLNIQALLYLPHFSAKILKLQSAFKCALMYHSTLYLPYHFDIKFPSWRMALCIPSVHLLLTISLFLLTNPTHSSFPHPITASSSQSIPMSTLLPEYPWL